MFLLNFYQGPELKVSGIVLEDRLTIGRNSDNSIVLLDSSISRHHATFLVKRVGDDVQVILQDTGSTNGCELNGSRFKGTAMLVRPEDSIGIGAYRVELLRRTPAPAAIADDGERNILYEGRAACQESLSVERLRALYNLTSGSCGLGLDELLEHIVKTISSSLKFDTLCVILTDEGKVQTLKTWTSEGSGSSSKVLISKRILDKCLQEGVAVLADKRRESLAPDSADTVGWKALNCAMCAPLVGGAKGLGAIYVASNTQAVIYDKDDLQFLILVANHLRSHLVNRKALQDLRAEAMKLEAILESLREGVVVTDCEFNILSANDVARQILGDKEPAGKSLGTALHGLEHTFDPQETPRRMYFEVTTKMASPGKEGPASRIFAAALSENTSSDGWKYVICLRDVTEAERIERVKSILVTRLAHKLRSPLTVITGVNTLMAQQMGAQLDPEFKALLDEGIKCSEECASLIDRFLEYTTLPTHGSKAARTTCHLDEIVDAAVLGNRDLTTKTGFKVSTSFEPGVTDVWGEKEKLRIVFHHIIQNAVKFGKRSGILQISATLEEDKVKIQFRDDGPGIPPEEKEFVFQMLHQVDTENTGEVPGAGLGLWLVREILQAHGGDIRIESPVEKGGGGTLVEVTLPSPPEKRCSISSAVDSEDVESILDR